MLGLCFGHMRSMFWLFLPYLCFHLSNMTEMIEQAPKYVFGNENYYFIYMYTEQLFIDFEKKLLKNWTSSCMRFAMVFVLQFGYCRA